MASGDHPKKTSTSSLITLSGMTCSGKSSLAQKLSATGFFNRVITATTRPPRALKERHEAHGVDYLFLSEADFQHLESSHGLIESTVFSNHRYGIPADSLYQVQRQGQIPLIITDPDGAIAVKQYGRKRGLDVLNVFLNCDIRIALARLKSRLERIADKQDETRLNALMCKESAWASQYPWDLTLSQFTDENFEWQLSLLLNSCRDGLEIAAQHALNDIQTEKKDL